MRQYIISVTMDDAGDLLNAALGLNASTPLLIYDKSFIGTRSKNGAISSRSAADFLQSPANFPQIGRLLLALDVLGLEGAADGLEDSARSFLEIFHARLDEQDAKGG